MSSSILPMTLGDMLDRTVRVVGRTFLRNAAIAITFLVIPTILLSMAANGFYSHMADFTGQAAVRNPQALAPFFLGGFYLGTAYTLFMLAVLLGEIAVSVVVAGELSSQRIDYGTAVKLTFNRRWINGIGEGILKALIFVGIGVFVSILIGIMAAAAGKGLHPASGLTILFIILFVAVLAGAIIYFALRLFFALTAVAVEDLGPINAFKKSWFLVGGHWWRTLGILIVFGLLSGFAISVISAPIMFGSMWKEYKELFTVMGQSQGRPDPTFLRSFQMGMGRMIGIAGGISSFLSLLITPVFTVVMYFDLRARHDDLPGDRPQAEGQDVPLVII